jgi:hypothetical protein
MFINRDPEDMKEGRLTPEQERLAGILRMKLAASDPGGPIVLGHDMPQMPPPEHAIRGGFYQTPAGQAPPTMPFRPPEQPVNEPPPRSILAQLLRGR